MDARDYDPAIGRWTGIDPVTHHSMSLYNAFDGNPVFWADPSGADGAAYSTVMELFHASASGMTTYVNDGEGFTLTSYIPDSFFGVQETSSIGSIAYILLNHFGGGTENYNPTFFEFALRIMNGATDVGKMINNVNDLMALVTGQDRHAYGPDAILFTKSVEGGAIVGATSGAGFIFVMRGEQAGFYTLGDYGVGVSPLPNISSGFTSQALYYNGEVSAMLAQTFAGNRYAVSISGDIGISIGVNGSYSSTSNGKAVYGVGISTGLGASPTILSVNGTYGETVIKSDKKK